LLILLYQHKAATRLDCCLSYGAYTGKGIEDDIVFEGIVSDNFLS